jgi:hypothetical protein
VSVVTASAPSVPRTVNDSTTTYGSALPLSSASGAKVRSFVRSAFGVAMSSISPMPFPENVLPVTRLSTCMRSGRCAFATKVDASTVGMPFAVCRPYWPLPRKVTLRKVGAPAAGTLAPCCVLFARTTSAMRGFALSMRRPTVLLSRIVMLRRRGSALFR